MDKFLEIWNLPWLTHEKIENLNLLITIKDIGLVIRTLSRKIYLGPYGFSEQFYYTFKVKLIPILELFQKIEEEETFTNSLYEVIITLIPKATQRYYKKSTNHKFPGGLAVKDLALSLTGMAHVWSQTWELLHAVGMAKKKKKKKKKGKKKSPKKKKKKKKKIY